MSFPAAALAMQHTVKQNAEEINSYLKDLQNWSNDVKSKDAALKTGKLQLSKPTSAPIRGSGNGSSSKVTLPSTTDRDQDRFASEKQKGNTAFMAGRFDDALQHYTQCTLLAPRSSVAFSNRSQALLKLARYHEAEADASTSIELDGSSANVKAWYRRATARKFLRKYAEALEDLKMINEKLDKNNKAAQTLAKEVEGLYEKQKAARAAASVPIVSSKPLASVPPSAPRRRMVITEEDDDDDEEEEEAEEKKAQPPATSATAAASPVKSTTAPTKSSPAAPAAAVPSPISASPTAASTSSPSQTSSPAAAAIPSFRPPKTAYEFDSTLRSTIRGDIPKLAAYLRVIPPPSYAEVMKTTMEASVLKNCIRAMNEIMKPAGDVSSIYSLLRGLPSVPRFNVARMMIDAKDKQAVCSLFQPLLSSAATLKTTASDLIKLASTQWGVNVQQ